MSDESSPTSKFDDQPLIDLIGQTPATMSDEELSAYIAAIRAKRANPTKRRAAHRKESHSLSGKTKSADISDLLG